VGGISLQPCFGTVGPYKGQYSPPYIMPFRQSSIKSDVGNRMSTPTDRWCLVQTGPKAFRMVTHAGRFMLSDYVLASFRVLAAAALDKVNHVDKVVGGAANPKPE